MNEFSIHSQANNSQENEEQVLTPSPSSTPHPSPAHEDDVNGSIDQIAVLSHN